MRTEKETKRAQKTNKEDTYDEKETMDAGTGILPSDSNATGGGIPRWASMGSKCRKRNALRCGDGVSHWPAYLLHK